MSSIDLESSSINTAPTASSSVYSVNESEEQVALRPVFTDTDFEVIVNAMPERPQTPVVLDIAPFEFEESSVLDYYRRNPSPKVIKETASATGLMDESLVVTQDASNRRLPFLRSSTANSREVFEQNDGINAAESTDPENILSGVGYFQPLKYVWNLACQIGQIYAASHKTTSLSSDKNPLLSNVAPEPIADKENFDNEDALTEDSWYEVDELANKLADTSTSEQTPIRLFPDRDFVEEPESYVEASDAKCPVGSPTDFPVVVEQDRYHFSIEMSPDDGKIVETMPVPSAAELARTGYYSNKSTDFLQVFPSHTSTRRGALVPPSTISSPYCPLINRSSAPSPITNNLPLSSTSSSQTNFREVDYAARRTLSLTSSPPSPRTTGKVFPLQSRRSILRRLTSRKRKHSLSDATDGYPPSTAYSSLSSRSSWGSQTTAEKSKQLCDRMIANSKAARGGQRFIKSHKRARTGSLAKHLNGN
ncbi:MAG: hypothetical protein LQ342_008125 [Letrouitia transgressa]|nr:MAG: hypothetical protein LQ342_008125 [Letrouitia transgressa]